MRCFTWFPLPYSRPSLQCVIKLGNRKQDPRRTQSFHFWPLTAVPGSPGISHSGRFCSPLPISSLWNSPSVGCSQPCPFLAQALRASLLEAVLCGGPRIGPKGPPWAFSVSGNLTHSTCWDSMCSWDCWFFRVCLQAVFSPVHHHIHSWRALSPCGSACGLCTLLLPSFPRGGSCRGRKRVWGTARACGWHGCDPYCSVGAFVPTCTSW